MKEQALKRLREIIEADVMLPLYGKANLVFGEGNADSDVLFIGEAPGANEDKEIRPFVGRAGQLLRKNIRDISWQESDVYITNIVKRRPPENRDPTDEEITAYRPYLARQIAIIDPKVIIPLGRFSMNYFLPEAKITRDQGKAFWVGNRLIIPMLHPAAALRGTTMLNDFEQTFRNLKKTIISAIKEKKSDDANSQNQADQHNVLVHEKSSKTQRAQEQDDGNVVTEQARLF